ncbi:MAG TPA: sugar phosphate nucleotidyltransferase [Spirochaetota bacterium]|nr:sugar phosphate nucleotidyltransferase [Spirochaetota bacterium]
MKKPQLVVMAAGMGSRYGGLKQIDTVGPNHETVVDYSIYDALQAGFGKVIFIIRKDIETAFRHKVAAAIEKHAETAYVFQEVDSLPAGFKPPAGREKPWGTGHAVLCARDAVDAPFAVINADDFYGSESFKKLASFLYHTPQPDKYAMIGFDLENTLSDNGSVSRGICRVSQKNTLLELTEYKNIQKHGSQIKYRQNDKWLELAAHTTVSMNMWGFTPDIFQQLEEHFTEFLQENLDLPRAEYFLPSVVDKIIHEDKKQIKILPAASRWVGVTYSEDKHTVKKNLQLMIDKGYYPEALWQD